MTRVSRRQTLNWSSGWGGSILILALCLSSGCGPKAPPAAPAQAGAPKPSTNAVAAVRTNASPAGANPLVGEFIDDPKLGKDPFFPKSVRRLPAAPAAVPGGAPSEKVEKPSVWSNLTLKAILGTKTRRLATVNRTTFGPGETAAVKFPGGSVRIKCVEIKSQSVIIEAEGEQRELFFRDAKK